MQSPFIQPRETVAQLEKKLAKAKRLAAPIGKWLVQFSWMGFTTSGNWIPVACSGFISEDCSRQELDDYMKEFLSTRNDGVNSKVEGIRVQAVTNEEAEYTASHCCFWEGKFQK